MITLNGGMAARYSFENWGDAFKRLAKWVDDGLVSEKELQAFTIQLFHQIPEENYNAINNES